MFLALRHETIYPEPEEVILNDPSPSENASTHNEHDTLSPKKPNEEYKSLCQKSDGDTPKPLNNENYDQVVLNDQNVCERYRTN